MRLRDADLSMCELDGQTVLLDLRSSKYLSINASGTYLLDQLRGGHTREALAAALVERFAIDAPTAQRDVDEFLEAMRRLNLLEDE